TNGYAEITNGYAEITNGYAEITNGYAEITNGLVQPSLLYERLCVACFHVRGASHKEVVSCHTFNLHN
ncbi:MAG: hypothetical protein V7K57_08805, partial [Nostoc sp.]|uniref:hypothetical protein n=1 Tax=Nostoc sp. TaxID=1180 RepID=UPI002FFBD768